MRELGVAIVCIDARQAHQSLKAMKANKTDPHDAAGLANLGAQDRKAARPPKGRVALARRLAVIMHAMLRGGPLVEA